VSAMDDCLGSCDTTPTNKSSPEAIATACVSCNAVVVGVGTDGPGANIHSSQGNDNAIDIHDEDDTGQPAVARAASDCGIAHGSAGCETSLRRRTTVKAMPTGSMVKIQKRKVQLARNGAKKMA